MNSLIEARIDSFCSHFGLQRGDLMTRSFPMGSDRAGGVGTEIILGANDPSKPEGRVKIGPDGQFITFNSNQPAVVGEQIVFEQTADFVAAIQACHAEKTRALKEAIDKGSRFYPLG